MNQSINSKQRKRRRMKRFWLRLVKNWQFWAFVAKYTFSAILVIAAARVTGQKILYWSLIELFLIFVISDAALKIKPVFGWILNGILMLIFNAEIILEFTGRSFITEVMVTNPGLLLKLVGTGPKTCIVAVFLVVISCIPAIWIKIPRYGAGGIIPFALAAELIATLFIGNVFSPLYAAGSLAGGMVDRLSVKSSASSLETVPSKFYINNIPNSYDKDPELPEKPNVVLIFTEGLSQEIVNDVRGLTPNIQMYAANGISFKNYYGHTFSTYRSLIGQLYSGYQLDAFDDNNLISVEEIFSNSGYHTSMYNTKPRDKKFTSYLQNLDFDQVISDRRAVLRGKSKTMADADAYEEFFEHLEEEAQGSQPFFSVLYTCGTELGQYSPDERFGDGTNDVLNKYYNVDYQFGRFMQKFESSSLVDNTIVIFTSNQAAYIDSDYYEAFPRAKRDYVDAGTIPLIIYYRGIKAQSINAKGRNSLDLAPTICDYLDITWENYFLGWSLFSNPGTAASYDTYFNDSVNTISTLGGKTLLLSGAKEDVFKESVKYYYALKLKERDE